MLNLIVDPEICTGCGQCVEDCPARIIDMIDAMPRIAPEREASCYRCQHCFAICPVGALSILGLRPEQGQPLAGNLPGPDRVETLIRGRRTVRRYRDENLDPALLQRLLDVAWQAPTGVNARQVRFTVVDDRKKMATLRAETLAGLKRLALANALPEGREYFSSFVQAWEERGADIIYRGAPHFVVASAPRSCPTPLPDCLIALSTLDLFACSLGVGTVWSGLAVIAISDLLPALRERLEIPADHLIGYAMALGWPEMRYARTAQRGPALVHRPAL